MEATTLTEPRTWFNLHLHPTLHTMCLFRWDLNKQTEGILQSIPFRVPGDRLLYIIPSSSHRQLDSTHHFNPGPAPKITDQLNDYAFDDRWPCRDFHHDSPGDYLENHSPVEGWQYCLQNIDAFTCFRAVLVVKRAGVCVTRSVFRNSSSFEDIWREKTRQIHASTGLDFFLLVCLSSSKFQTPVITFNYSGNKIRVQSFKGTCYKKKILKCAVFFFLFILNG